jgi:hypothetical protein
MTSAAGSATAAEFAADANGLKMLVFLCIFIKK